MPTTNLYDRRSELPAIKPPAGVGSNPLDALVDRIVCGEQESLAALKRYRPWLELYLQETLAGGAGKQAEGIDHYLIGRLSLGDGMQLDTFLRSDGFRSRRTDPTGAVKQRPWLRHGNRRAAFSPAGFARMIAPDFEAFTARAYRFEYVRREFLGDIRCLVVNLFPRQIGIAARFMGRVWVEDQDGCVVRFSGTFVSSKPSAIFFHFDSWRFQLAPRLWLPAFTYIEDQGPTKAGQADRFTGQLRLWGYGPARCLPAKGTAEIVAAAGGRVDDTGLCQAAGPLESRFWWQRSAERNVIDRLEQSGLLAAEGEVDETLNKVIQNLLLEQDPAIEVRCRVLLTTPLETFSIGQAIVISRGLLDVLPDEASLAMVLSDELAHILLGHPIDSMFAFADRVMFPDREIARRLRLQRSVLEMEAAHRKALELLSHSPYSDKMTTAGLFLKTLRRRAPQLPNLIRASFGNQLTTEEDLVRLGDLAKKTPELKTARGEQVAALPLGSRLDLDPWTNEIRMLEGKPLVPKNGTDDAHFGVFPMMMNLRRTTGGFDESAEFEEKTRSAVESPIP